MSKVGSRKKMRLWKNIILFALSVIGIHYWLKTKSYIFDADTLLDVETTSGAGKSLERKLKAIIEQLEDKYPGLIVPEKYREWIMLKTGGYLGSLYPLHVSLTEYVLFTGNAIESQGHSGRHWINITMVLLSGSVQEWRESTLQTTMYLPGDKITIPSGHAASFRWQQDTWALEYGRGFMPFSMPYFMADSLFSSLDFLGIFKMLKVFSRAYFYTFQSDLAAFIASI